MKFNIDDFKTFDSLVIAFCVGYLMKHTGNVFDVSIERHHLDWQIECSYGDFCHETRCMPIEKKFFESSESISKMLAMYLDEILADWDLENE